MGHKMFFGFAEHVKVMSTLHCSLFSIMSKKKNHDTYLNLEISLKNANHHLTMQDATITNWEAHTHTHTHKQGTPGRRCRFDPWVGKIPWRKKWQPTLVFLLGKFHG